MSQDKATRIRVTPETLDVINQIVSALYPSQTRMQRQVVSDISDMVLRIVQTYQKQGLKPQEIRDKLCRR